MFSKSKQKSVLLAISLSVLLVFFSFPINSTHAFNSGIAHYQTIEASLPVPDGSIISLQEGKYILSNQAYDQNVYGVVSIDAPIILKSQPEVSANTYPILSNGETKILVNNTNGVIKKGDLVTTSTIPGVAMKADKDGFIVGQALEDTLESNDNQLILVSLKLSFYEFKSISGLVNDPNLIKSFFLNMLGALNFSAQKEPNQAFKYIMSSIVLITSLFFGYRHFMRLAHSGIEAIGRNPLAGRMIMIGITLNVVISVVVILSGFLLAYFIINL
jgi:hypothetical protein